MERLYVDAGSEFMGVFCEYGDTNNEHIVVFKASTGTKRRLEIEVVGGTPTYGKK